MVSEIVLKVISFNFQVLSIMNDLKDGASWQYALRHIPIRKQKCCVFDNDMKAKKMTDYC